LQSVDFVKVFQSVIIVLLPLVAAGLVLCQKTATLICVTDNVVVEVFHMVGNIFLYKFLIIFTVTFCNTSTL